MATIRKQSIYSSLYIYAGFVFGAINVLYFFPKYFTPEQFGLTRILMDIALIFSTLCTAGMIPIAFKFSPFYKHHLEKSKNDLFTLSFLIAGIACLLLLFLLPYLQPIIIRKFGYRSPLLIEYIDWIFPMTVGLVVFTLMEAYAWVISKNVVSNFLKEFLYRILVTVLIVFWAFKLIEQFETFIAFYALLYSVLILAMGWILYRSKYFNITFIRSKLTKKYAPMMVKFGSAYFLSALLNILAKTNDTLIIASQSSGGLKDAAIFTIATYLITLMDVPQRSMVSSATIQIAEAWKSKDMAKLDRLYKKTALTLLITALGIMGIVLINAPLLVKYLGDTYMGLPLLMIILGSGKLIELGTGLNAQILQLSKHWRVDLFTNMFFVGISIILNYFLTKNLGLTGTAIGSVIAIVLFNLIRFIYIKRLLQLQPFTVSNVWAMLIAILWGVVCYFIPLDNGELSTYILKSILFIGGFGFTVVRMNLSPDITDLFQQIKNKIVHRS
jgi:O-antigen/teichoic acid export membrane protein